MTKKCKNCYWYDQCGQDRPCSYFDPIETDVNEKEKKKEYEITLKERVSVYQRIVEEQQK